MPDLPTLLARHRERPFPDGCRGEQFGGVDAVLIDADIYGWALTASEGSLSEETRRALITARNDLRSALPVVPVEVRAYYEGLVELADEALSAKALIGEEAAAVIQSCLYGWADGPFIEDWEFVTVTGLSRVEVSAVADAWPRIDGDNVDHAVRAALGNLLGYPHGLSLEEHVGFSEEAVAAARQRWTSAIR